MNMEQFILQAKKLLKQKKNIILQGAPGTGKTYSTASLAVALIDENIISNHSELISRYEQLRKENRIGFTTFHQSMDYEDFIEGIKVMNKDNQVQYKVEDGIFKRLCNAAQIESDKVDIDHLFEGLNEKPQIWKVSLEGAGHNETRRDCMENGYIRIGWSEYGDIDFDKNPDIEKGRLNLRAFQKEMKVGDLIVSCWNKVETDAIGIITGDYTYKKEGNPYPRYRNVRWIVKGINYDIKGVNNDKSMTSRTIHRLNIPLADIRNIVMDILSIKNALVEKREKPFVLIIDEINRGNISKIFGELITLLEKDKRIGAEHPLTLSLPYSKQSDFGVPKNLYIIGTMNTTDRSTGTIDYAIRRRFAFLTLPASREILQNEVAVQLFDNVVSFIKRYKYADMDIEDLMIGHSYFMSEDNDEFIFKVQYEIIPLIKEYIKDGILSVRPLEAQKYYDRWLKLETYNDNDTGTRENQ